MRPLVWRSRAFVAGNPKSSRLEVIQLEAGPILDVKDQRIHAIEHIVGWTLHVTIQPEYWNMRFRSMAKRNRRAPRNLSFFPGLLPDDTVRILVPVLPNRHKKEPSPDILDLQLFNRFQSHRSITPHER